MDGFEFIRKANERFSHLKYFILTGYDISHEIVNAINEGLIENYLGKPFDIQSIENRIWEAVNE